MNKAFDSHPASSRRWRSMLLVFVLAVAVRGFYSLYAFADPTPSSLAYDDERWYWALAESLHRGEGLVGEFGHRAERMPLYPGVLALFAGAPEGVGRVRVLQWFVGGLAAVATMALARRWCRWPVLAGVAVACDPALAGMAGLLLTETFFVTAIAGLWLAAWSVTDAERSVPALRRWVGVGVLAALAIYLREAGVAFVALLLGYVIWRRRDRRSLVGAAVAGVLVVAALVPWGIRNQRVLGAWYWFTTRGGISLYDGVRPGATGTGDLAGVKDAPEVAGLDEVAWDRHFRTESRRAIREEPGRILALVPTKLARTWSPWVHAYSSRVIRLIFAAWYVPLYVAAIVGLWALRHEWRSALYLLIPALAVTLLHSVFIGSVRYRVGAIPGLAVLAAAGVECVILRLRAKRPGQEPAS